MPHPRHPSSLDTRGTPSGVTDLLHLHLNIGLQPDGACPACDQHRAGVALASRRYDAVVIPA